MARLLCEVWRTGPRGLPSCILAGPEGDAARALHDDPQVLVHTFWAGSHIEAMTIYNAYLGREPYESPYPELDARPFSDESRRIQQDAGIVDPA